MKNGKEKIKKNQLKIETSKHFINKDKSMEIIKNIKINQINLYNRNPRKNDKAIDEETMLRINVNEQDNKKAYIEIENIRSYYA